MAYKQLFKSPRFRRLSKVIQELSTLLDFIFWFLSNYFLNPITSVQTWTKFLKKKANSIKCFNLLNEPQRSNFEALENITNFTDLLNSTIVILNLIFGNH